MNALRFDFRMADVLTFVDLMESHGVTIDPFASACRVAAHLALGGVVAPDAWTEVRRDSRLSPKVAHVVLLGLWLSNHPDRAELILEVSRPALGAS